MVRMREMEGGRGVGCGSQKVRGLMSEGGPCLLGWLSNLVNVAGCILFLFLSLAARLCFFVCLYACLSFSSRSSSSFLSPFVFVHHFLFSYFNFCAILSVSKLILSLDVSHCLSSWFLPCGNRRCIALATAKVRLRKTSSHCTRTSGKPVLGLIL